MGWVDIVLLTVLVLSALLGLWRGLVYEVLSLAGWIVAFLMAQAYSTEVAALLPMGDAAPALRLAAGFALVFVAVAFAGGFVAWIIKKLVASVGLRPVDRLLGGVFGVARGVLILLAVTVIVSMTSLHTDPDWQASPMAGGLSQGLGALKPMLPQAVASQLP